MRVTDPTEWFDDLTVHIDDEELIEQAKAIEPTLLHVGSRVGAALWLIIVGVVAGAFGGFTFSDEVQASWLIFVAYVIAGSLLLRVLKPVSERLLGPTIAWQSVLAFFWSFLLAMTAVLSGGIDTVWLGHMVSAGCGLLIGLMYGSLNPGFIGREDAWLLAALPIGALSTWSSASVQRAFEAGSDFRWSEAFVGTMAASVFMVPMAILMAMLSSKSNALAKMATLYLHNENFTSKAIECLDEAIALSPRSAELYNLRGIAHSKAGHEQPADADFRKVTELSPRAAEAHMNRGVELMRQGLFDRSIEALQYATTVNPKLATAFSNLGTAYLKKGELDAAIDSYNRAIAIRAKYPMAFSNRAYAYYLKGDYEHAIADATRALALNPELPMAHANLGHALAGKGETALAARSFRRVLELDADPTVAEEALVGLEKLGARAGDDDEDEER